jgi:hypothetical protein
MMLVPDALTLNYGEPTLLQIIHYYYALARSSPAVVGLDFFIWENVPKQFNGLVAMPTLRATVFAFARQVSMECGNAYNKIPVLQYALDGKDVYYSAWMWDGFVGSNYVAQGAVFALPTADASLGAVPLYECTIIQSGASATNHWLTQSATCDNLAHSGSPQLLGAIFVSNSTVSGVLPLWRYCALANPWYHVYTTFDGQLNGLVRETIIGYVYGLNAL